MRAGSGTAPGYDTCGSLNNNTKFWMTLNKAKKKKVKPHVFLKKKNKHKQKQDRTGCQCCADV